MLLRELEVEKYWYFPSSYSKEKRESELRNMMLDGHHYYQLKTDGHYGAFICDNDGQKMLLGRGTSRVTGERTHYEDSVFFFEDMCNIFDKPTYLVGEVWYEGAVDKQVGSVLRAKPNKAKSIQNKEFYEQVSKTIKFTPKDRRDIEGNKFFNQKLRYRIFDCWFYDGVDLMNTPWIERQKYAERAAETINNPLITYVPYYAMDENFLEHFNALLAQGEEGVVCYLDSGTPAPGKREAHKTCKLKRDVGGDLDVFIYSIEAATKSYQGGAISTWPYWQNTRTQEFVYGSYFGDYQQGGSYEPVSKNFFNGWPAAIAVGVYDKNKNIVPVCKVSGLSEEFKEELKNNFKNYYLCPVTIGGMALSDSNGISVRHPYLKTIREGTLTADDCTLEKLLS